MYVHALEHALSMCILRSLWRPGWSGGVYIILSKVHFFPEVGSSFTCRLLPYQSDSEEHDSYFYISLSLSSGNWATIIFYGHSLTRSPCLAFRLFSVLLSYYQSSAHSVSKVSVSRKVGLLWAVCPDWAIFWKALAASFITIVVKKYFDFLGYLEK